MGRGTARAGSRRRRPGLTVADSQPTRLRLIDPEDDTAAQAEAEAIALAEAKERAEAEARAKAEREAREQAAAEAAKRAEAEARAKALAERAKALLYPLLSRYASALHPIRHSTDAWEAAVSPCDSGAVGLGASSS